MYKRQLWYITPLFFLIVQLATCNSLKRTAAITEVLSFYYPAFPLLELHMVQLLRMSLLSWQQTLVTVFTYLQKKISLNFRYIFPQFGSIEIDLPNPRDPNLRPLSGALQWSSFHEYGVTGMSISCFDLLSDDALLLMVLMPILNLWLISFFMNPFLHKFLLFKHLW